LLLALFYFYPVIFQRSGEKISDWKYHTPALVLISHVMVPVPPEVPLRELRILVENVMDNNE